MNEYGAYMHDRELNKRDRIGGIELRFEGRSRELKAFSFLRMREVDAFEKKCEFIRCDMINRRG